VRTVSRFVFSWVVASTTAWQKGLVKCHMSASQVLIAPTYYTTLAPNDDLPDHNVCSQCNPWMLIALNLLLKTFTQLVGARKCRDAPNTPDPLCAKDTRYLIRFARNGSNRRSPHPWHKISLKFGIFICDRNSKIC